MYLGLLHEETFVHFCRHNRSSCLGARVTEKGQDYKRAFTYKMARGQSFTTSVEALRLLFSFLWMFLTGWGWQPPRDPLRSRQETSIPLIKCSCPQRNDRKSFDFGQRNASVWRISLRRCVPRESQHEDYREK